MPSELEELIRKYKALRVDLVKRALVVEKKHPDLYAAKFSRQLIELMELGFNTTELTFKHELGQQTADINRRFDEQMQSADDIKHILGLLLNKIEQNKDSQPGIIP